MLVKVRRSSSTAASGRPLIREAVVEGNCDRCDVRRSGVSLAWPPQINRQLVAQLPHRATTTSGRGWHHRLGGQRPAQQHSLAALQSRSAECPTSTSFIAFPRQRRVHNVERRGAVARLEATVSISSSAGPALPGLRFGSRQTGGLGLRWPRLFGQSFRFDKWIVCRG